MENTVFALDIGTRKIAGVVLQKADHKYMVLDSEIIEHTTRAMLDGQIHDVEAVADSINIIKRSLEKRLSTTFHSAAVAAAGRALKTSKGIAERERVLLTEIDREEVSALEIAAVQEAQYKLSKDEYTDKEDNSYFCVGYSVASYTLEGQEIGSLVGQVGARIAVEVIATFLPRVVVDSLFSSLKRAGLEIYSMTLEPIAALSVAIPPNMRRLNLALVDIGAGTSDIAIIKEGNIFAYAMVPIGGDELTECISSAFLLDFDTAEKVKCLLNQQDEIEFIDILGNNTSLKSGKIIDSLQAVINELVQNIAMNILELNGKAPDAVICVGGGSLTPGLKEALSERMNMPLGRVGLRTAEGFKEIEFSDDFFKGPQGVTPLGIAYNSCLGSPVPFIKVAVNGREVLLWNTGNNTVAQALLSSGISLHHIYGKPGLGKTIEVNGSVKVFKGEIGKPPVIKVNEEHADLETAVKDEDVLCFSPGEDGKEGRAFVRDLVSAAEGFVYINDDKVAIKPVVYVDGQEALLDDEIPDRAHVSFFQADTAGNLLCLTGVPYEYTQEKIYHCQVQGENVDFTWLPIEIWIDDHLATPAERVISGSYIKYSYRSLHPRIKDIMVNCDAGKLAVTVNGQEVLLENQPGKVILNGKPVSSDTEISDGGKIELAAGQDAAILSDIFRVISIEPSPGKLVMTVDGEEAGFTTPIFAGSKIELKWDN